MSYLWGLFCGSEDSESEQSKNETCCNHGHGEPDDVFYHERKNVMEETWTFKARYTYKCDDCGAEINATQEIGKVAIDDDENLVIQDE